MSPSLRPKRAPKAAAKLEPRAPRVKICGITSLADALAAVDAGADALGLNFFSGSPRHISVRAAAAWVPKLPPLVSTVGVFVNAEPRLVQEALGSLRLDFLQFHGDEQPDDLALFPWDKQIRAVRIKDKRSLAELKRWPRPAAWLLDAYAPKSYGGTGKAFRWDLAREAGKRKPVILAGGLTPSNVAQAVREARPYAVDVASGVECAPGKKDADKMRAFVRAAKNAWF